jgi:hypothetical protein
VRVGGRGYQSEKPEFFRESSRLKINPKKISTKTSEELKDKIKKLEQNTLHRERISG